MATLDEATRSTLEKEILPFLNKSARTDVKSLALEYFLGMTGSPEGRQFISKGDKYLEGIISLTIDEHEAIMKDALYSLLNLATDEDTAWRLLNMEKYPNNGINWMRLALDKEYKLADVMTGLVSNVTRSLKCAEKLVSEIAESEDISIEKIVYALCDLQHNKAAKLHYLGPILSNLTQVPYIRQEVTNKDRCIIQRLLPFTEFSASEIRRGGVIGAIRNCCFDSSYHEWLLGDDVDILPRLLLPLAGGEEFDDDDMEKLPIDLQYLPPDKTREPDSDIRLMLIETINQLLATKHGRRVMKEKNVYVIMREFHKWETTAANNHAIQNVVDILIGDEPEEGMENLHLVDIPKETEEKFKESDKELAKEIAEDEADGQE
ncbi:protein HGH1 homolog [Patella vulgata]|uniref:protein HGH1 homolog n=1 Tax=Patella vulgata TaxID=6465 RepID=UPI00217F2EB6|nr:protein HGH1 homolog [Patella vulgata]XP_055958055.1 protein HGH1 homolog [Patella vulgata]